jgi:hypothetical protein
MTGPARKRFIRELIRNVQKTLIDNSSKMPEGWNGIEIRQYVADKFAEQTINNRDDADMRRRFKDYRNEVIVRNL